MQQLEEMHFKYERLGALVSCLQSLIAEGAVEVTGLPENALSHALYDIEDGLYETNKAFEKLNDEMVSRLIDKR